MIDKNSLTGSKTIVDTSSIALALYRNREKQNKKQEEENGIRYTDFVTCYLIKNRYRGIYSSFQMLFHPETGLYSPVNKNKNIISQEDIEKDMQ